VEPVEVLAALDPDPRRLQVPDAMLVGRTASVACNWVSSSLPIRSSTGRTWVRSGRVVGAWSGCAVHRENSPYCTTLLAAIWSEKTCTASAGSTLEPGA
jgi:hypothetical protein